MSIYGPVVTTLQLYGGPGAPIGSLYRRLLIPLIFQLQIAGPDAVDFGVAAQACQDANDGIQVIVYVLDNLLNPVDLSASSATFLKFLKPDGSAVKIAAAFLTNGMDGALTYTTTETDFVQDGVWQVQAAFILAGDHKTTRWGSFTVYPNILVA